MYPASDETAETDRRVLEWKFNSLDINGDLQLSRDEYRALRELVRKVVKPKRCARAFSKHCDLDRDTNIAQQEWITCLGLDVNRKYLLQVNPSYLRQSLTFL